MQDRSLELFSDHLQCILNGLHTQNGVRRDRARERVSTDQGDLWSEQHVLHLVYTTYMYMYMTCTCYMYMQPTCKQSQTFIFAKRLGRHEGAATQVCSARNLDTRFKMQRHATCVSATCVANVVTHAVQLSSTHAHTIRLLS